MCIDFLYDNETALRACALVQSSWLLPARYHLFGFVYLRLEYTFQGTVDGMIRPWHWTIKHNIRRLSIWCGGIACRWQLYIESFAYTVSYLPTLKELTLIGVSILTGSRPRGSSDDIISHPVRLLHLDMMVVTPAVIQVILAYFPPQESLILGRDVDHHPDRYWWHDVTLTSDVVSRLALQPMACWRLRAGSWLRHDQWDDSDDDNCFRNILCMLCQTCIVDQVRDLHLEELRAADIPCLKEFFSEFGIHVLHLHLDLKPIWEDSRTKYHGEHILRIDISSIPVQLTYPNRKIGCRYYFDSNHWLRESLQAGDAKHRLHRSSQVC